MHKSLNIEHELLVPQNPELRKSIRIKVDAYFAVEPISPPVSYDQLNTLATGLISQNNWDSRYTAFVMICCGNSIWRSVLEAIPFDRRILLLPQCLQSTSSCKALRDEMGLLCSECGNCMISEILQQAENLGYVGLVTEGTTITTRLIESGKVDAVIGVGCMEVLQKMFSSVSRYAIPGIGIPLLGNGCKDTVPDLDWIKEEMNHFKPNRKVSMINLNHLLSKTKSMFGQEQIGRILGHPKSETEQIAIESLLAGGHRFRPFLAQLTYEAFAGAPDPDISIKLAASMECFHKASLIHDDIEDNDHFRNGKEAIHAKHGIPVALNVGDLLLGKGYQLLLECNLPPEIIVSIYQVVSIGHINLTLGQGAELISGRENIIPTPEQTIQNYENKTSAAFQAALLAGAVAGKADPDSLGLLGKFSLAIGVAYQIMDDLEDFDGNSGDLSMHRFSIILSVLQQSLQPDEMPEFESALKNKKTESTKRLAEKYNARIVVQDMLVNYVEMARESISKLQNIGLKLALYEITGKMFDAYLKLK